MRTFNEYYISTYRELEETGFVITVNTLRQQLCVSYILSTCVQNILAPMNDVF